MSPSISFPGLEVSGTGAFCSVSQLPGSLPCPSMILCPSSSLHFAAYYLVPTTVFRLCECQISYLPLVNRGGTGESSGPNNQTLLFLVLPYLIDGTHKLTQSNAILRYIARKHNLCEWVWSWGQGHQWPCPGLGCNGRLRVNLCCVATGGETEEEMIRVDILENQVMDVRFAMARICYSPDFVSPLSWGDRV